MRVCIIYVIFVVGILNIWACKPLDVQPQQPVQQEQEPVQQEQAPQPQQDSVYQVNGVFDTSQYTFTNHKVEWIDGHQYVVFNTYGDEGYCHYGGCQACARIQARMIDSLLFKYIVGTQLNKSEVDTTILIKKQIDSLQNVLKGATK